MAGSMHRRILKLALPSILANITVPLVGMADTAVAGRLGSASFIGGIAVGTMLFDLLYWNFAFLRVGTGGLAAQAFGKGDMKEAAGIFVRGILTSFICAMAVWLVQWLVVTGAFAVIDCSDRVRELATQYFNIRIWAAPATLGLFVFKGWFIGMQDTVRPMVLDVFVNVVNIAVSAWLALGTDMGFAGVAAGTVAAQYSGFLLAWTLLALRYGSVFRGMGKDEVLARMKGMSGFFRMNGHLFIRSVCFIFVYIGFTTISARYGDVVLAVGSVVMKLLMVFSFFIDGFAYAGEALSGRYVGARDEANFRSAVRKIFLWGACISVAFTAVYWKGSALLVGVLADDPAVRALSQQYVPWLMLMPLLGCAAFVWDGIYIGATRTKDIRNSMIWAAAAFFVIYYAGAFAFGLPHGGVMQDAVTYSGGSLHADPLALKGLHVLCAAYFGHLLMRSLYLTLRGRRLLDVF